MFMFNFYFIIVVMAMRMGFLIPLPIVFIGGGWRIPQYLVKTIDLLQATDMFYVFGIHVSFQFSFASNVLMTRYIHGGLGVCLCALFVWMVTCRSTCLRLAFYFVLFIIEICLLWKYSNNSILLNNLYNYCVYSTNIKGRTPVHIPVNLPEIK